MPCLSPHPAPRSGTTSSGIQGQVSSTAGWLTISPVTSCLTQLSVNTSPPGASCIRRQRPWTNRRAGGNGLPATPQTQAMCPDTAPGGWGGSVGSRLGRRRFTQQGWKGPLVPAARLSPGDAGNSKSGPRPTQPTGSNVHLEKAAAPPTPLPSPYHKPPSPPTTGKFSFKRESQGLSWWSSNTPCSQCRGLSSIPGQGTRSHMLQLRPGAAK